MAVFWLVVGVILLVLGISHLSDLPARPYGVVITLFFSSIYIIIPIGVFLRTRWGYYGGLILSTVMLFGFPVGTILAVMTMKAYADGKLAFGVL